MTKVYVLIEHGYHESSTIYGIFSSQADAARVQSRYEESDVEEWDLDELVDTVTDTVPEWVVTIDVETGKIGEACEEASFRDTDFVRYRQDGLHFTVRSRTSAEHAMGIAEEESRKWIAVIAAEAEARRNPAPYRSLESQPSHEPPDLAICFYCRSANMAKPDGDATGPTPNLWGYARDGAGELLCCSRCLADYHAGQPVRLVPMEHAADGKPEPAMAGGKATMVEPWTPGR